MKTFEEEFPSLKEAHCATIEFNRENKYFILTTDIQENCLDKQRVKEAIERLASHGEGCRCPVKFNGFAKHTLLEELGLK